MSFRDIANTAWAIANVAAIGARELGGEMR